MAPPFDVEFILLLLKGFSRFSPLATFNIKVLLPIYRKPCDPPKKGEVTMKEKQRPPLLGLPFRREAEKRISLLRTY